MTLLRKVKDRWYFNLKLIHGSFSDGMFWVRITNGLGFKIKDTTKHILTFSERYGYAKMFNIGKWCITMIDKN